MRHRAVFVSLIALLLALTIPAGAVDLIPRNTPKDVGAKSQDKHHKKGRDHKRHPNQPVKPGPTEHAGLAAYRGLGTWIDMYDHGPWSHPERTVRGMARRGVKTLYLQSSNYHKKTELYHPTLIGRFLDAAERQKVKVVGWYVPGFKNMPRDRKRIRAALDYVSPNKNTWDAFAMDIEATKMGRLRKRNERMLNLSIWLRDRLGKDYPLGGIVPDVQSLFWPGFPYDQVARHYDVLMPMGYFTYRVNGAKAVYRYTVANVKGLRRRASDRNVPIHPIGGVGGDSSRREVRSYVRALNNHDVVGGSYYDYPITDEHEWKALERLRG